MGQWPSSNYLDLCKEQSNIAQTRFSTANFTNEKAFAFTNTLKISGQKTVKSKDDLQYIPAAILSAQIDNYNSYPEDKKKTLKVVLDGSDALGQIWWVQDDKCFYQLVKWGKNPPTDNVWAKTNIKSTLSVGDGTSTDVDINTINKNNSWVTSVILKGDGTATYTHDGLHLKKTTSTYTYSNNSNTSTFEVIDKINYDPSSANPHQLSYNVKTVKVLSQNHHSNTYSWDSNPIDLGTAGIFTDNGTGRPDTSLGSNISDLEEDHVWMLKTDDNYSKTNNNHQLSRIITGVGLSSTGELSYTYAFPRNWIHGMSSYSGKDYTYIGYAQNGKYNATYLNPASDTNQGPLSAADYKLMHDHTLDIEERLEPQKEMNVPMGKMEYNIEVWDTSIKNKLATYTSINDLSSKSSIIVEQGTYVKASGIYPSFLPELFNPMKISSTDGSWGGASIVSNPLPTRLPNDQFKWNVDNPNGNGPKSINKHFIKNHGKSDIWIDTTYILKQNAVGIKVYGKKCLVSENGGLVRKTTNNVKVTVETSLTINIRYGVCRWYGVCKQDPKTLGENITEFIKNISSDTNHVNKDSNETLELTISNTKYIHTSSEYPYFIYVYPQAFGEIGEIGSGKQDATMWFNTINNTVKPVRVKIQSERTKYTDDYYLIYALGVNSLNTTPSLNFIKKKN